ncbi:hypothetical protein LCGC14_1473490, partial [marine sediment metagenome]
KIEEILGTNYIDRADCESVTPPMVVDETVPLLTNATITRSNEEKRNGDYSYKIIKTAGVGGWAWVRFVDNSATDDMHGLVAGKTYTFEVWVYVPIVSGIALNEFKLYLGDYQGGWQNTGSSFPTVYDTWEKLIVTRTLRSSATGVIANFEINGSAALNEYFYVDDFRLRKLEEETGSLWIVSKARELIDRGNCEDPIAPMVFHEFIPIETDASFERSADFARSGDYSYKVTKTAASGTPGQAYLVDYAGSTDMHGLVAGKTYTFELWVYVPSGSGIALNEIKLNFLDYQGGWAGTDSGNPASFDTWVKLTVTRTVRSSATGIMIRIWVESAAELNEYFYIDDATLKNVFLDNEEITDEDTGVADVDGTPADDGFIILNNYAGVTNTGDLTIEADEDYDDFQAIDDSAWTIKKADWNADADDLPIVDFGAAVYKLYMNNAWEWIFKNMMIKNSLAHLIHSNVVHEIQLIHCILEKVNVGSLVASTSSYSSIRITNCICRGSATGVSQYGIYMVGGSPLMNLKNCAVYNLGNRGIIAVNGGEFENVNIGIELANGAQDIHLYENKIKAKNLSLGGKNDDLIISAFSSHSYISIENFNRIKASHAMEYLNGQILKKDVVAESGDPYKRSDGANSVIEISCDSNALYAPAPDEWKYLVFEHEYEMDTAPRSYRYYVQCKAMSLVATELFLECEYVEQYVSTTVYHDLKVRSDEIVSERTGADDWSQYLEVTGIQPAVTSKVRIKCYLSKYDADGRIFIDPKVVVS